MADDLGKLGLAMGVAAGAFGDGAFSHVLGPVDPGPASTPFAAVGYLSCHCCSLMIDSIKDYPVRPVSSNQ